MCDESHNRGGFASPPRAAFRGILLAGGGTLTCGLDELVAAETGMPVCSAESPFTYVVTGCG
jgi:actin-like ATPase involved in cell morphogenesis